MQSSILWSLSVPELANSVSLHCTPVWNTYREALFILKYRRRTQNKADLLQSLMGNQASRNSRGRKKHTPLHTKYTMWRKTRLQLNILPAPLSSHYDDHQVRSLHKRRNFWKAFIVFHSVSASGGVQQKADCREQQLQKHLLPSSISIYFWQIRLSMKLYLRNGNSSACHIKMKNMRDVRLNGVWKEGQALEEFGGDINLKNKFLM